MVSVCFVCLGNICRSPTAEGIMLSKIRDQNLELQIHIDSAGTSAYHVGETADSRSRDCAQKRGYHLPSRARQFTTVDLDRFDYIIAMDTSNLQNILRLCTNEEQKKKVYLFRDFDGNEGPKDVPDPYYGGASGFDDVLDICERCCDNFIDFLYTHKKLQ